MNLAYKLFGQCCECKRIFAMKKFGEELVRTENVNVVEVLYQPHPKGEIQTMVERFTPGERKTYEITYACRFCGAKHTKFTYKVTKK